MKRLILSFGLLGACLGDGYPDPGILAVLDVDGNGHDDVQYYRSVSSGGASGIRRIVGHVTDTILANNAVNYVTPNRKRVFASVGEVIRDSWVVVDLVTGIGLTAYVADNDPGGWLHYYMDYPNNLNAETVGILGLRLRMDDGFHYGWIRFTRPDTDVQTAFSVADWDFNPLPGEPIRAGYPPEIPISAEWIQGENQEVRVRVSWPLAVSSWVLETTTQLGPSAQWVEYPVGGTPAEIPVGPEEPSRYFRLRKP